ncbi:MAG: CoA-binding protein [Armatimonadota bacterium]
MGDKLNVAVLGATDDPTKYAHRAMRMLEAHGYNTIPVTATKETIDGLKAYHSLRDIPVKVDTVTVYVRPTISAELEDDFLAVRPRRVIFNPGTENPELIKVLESQGIEVKRACTLVLLHTGQF